MKVSGSKQELGERVLGHTHDERKPENERIPQENINMPLSLKESDSEPESSESPSNSQAEECVCADILLVSDETIMQINCRNSTGPLKVNKYSQYEGRPYKGLRGGGRCVLFTFGIKGFVFKFSSG